MKHLISLFAVLFLFALTSCSDVNDNSLLTNPVLDKTTTLDSGIETAPVYPYPYLFNFTQLQELKFTTLEGQNSIDFYMPEGSPKFSHLFVVVNYNQEVDSKMFFVDKISDNSFKVEGVIASDVQKISVYGFEVGYTEENISYPFTNNSAMSEIAISSWKNDIRDVSVECAGIWPSSLKYVFAQLDTKYGSFLVFLQRPYSSNFVIPEYGKFGVESMKLYAYQTVMEKYVAQN